MRLCLRRAAPAVGLPLQETLERTLGFKTSRQAPQKRPNGHTSLSPSVWCPSEYHMQVNYRQCAAQAPKDACASSADVLSGRRCLGERVIGEQLAGNRNFDWAQLSSRRFRSTMSASARKRRSAKGSAAIGSYMIQLGVKMLPRNGLGEESRSCRLRGPFIQLLLTVPNYPLRTAVLKENQSRFS